MGKKMNKKAPNPRKAQNRISVGSPKSVLDESGGDGDKDKKVCNHYSKSTAELSRILIKIRSSSMDAVACEHCRDDPVNRRGGNEKGKQSKRKGAGRSAAEAKSERNFMWVCLDCGRYFCGGGVSILEPYGHARRHAKQDHHQWAVRADDPIISWCYACSFSVPIEMPEDLKNDGNEITNNDRSSSLRGIAFEPFDSEKLKGHKVRGLSNLGNTCFFNAVMQNLFAMDLLRDNLLGLDRPLGPLSVVLRNLFTETSRGADSKGVINPKALFGCICAKASQFRGYQQQDSHELLRHLLDGLHVEETNARKSSEFDDDEKISTKTKASLVDAIFCGQLSSTVSCMECRNTSVVTEPFLDLSLPVPSKKHPPKKVPPLPPKRANQRDKNKAQQSLDRGVPQMSTMSVNQNSESNEQSSECSESGVAVPLPTHADAAEAQDLAWMDYLVAESPNCSGFNAHDLEASIAHSTYTKQENETATNVQSVSELRNGTGNIVQSVSDLHTASCSNDLTVSLDAFVERSSNDEVPHSCAPATEVILLPYKDQDQDLADLDMNDRTSYSQDSVNVNTIDVSISESCDANSSCKQADEEFDGFGDLFNEPESTSHLNAENNAGEDMDITLLNGNISESNLEEVDDTDVPVSINSCLTLFTKPELLSDEQGWYCERCSEMLQENREPGTSKLQAAEVSDLSVNLTSMLDEDEVISNKFDSNSHGYVANVKVLDNGKLVSSSKTLAIQFEERFDQCEEISCSQKQIGQGGSQSSGEISSNKTIHLTKTTPCSSMACWPDDLDKDMSDSETSELFSTTICVDGSSNQESSFHGINDRSYVENDGKKPKVAFHSSQSQTDILLHKSNIDRSQEVSRVRKKGLKSGKALPEERGEGVKMVKRDATKRILIDRVPPILTIHLKRFGQDARGRLTKLSGHVHFQETLDMRSYMDPRCIEDRTSYRLIGVVEHSGSMSRGHYVAYVRGDGRGSSRTSSGSSSSTGQAWFYASDAYVREVSIAEVLQSEAYILFYEKV
ncbi:ubiquitin carboxyl-terminal hydrolase 2 [Phalaenopsis equestris]|uniref:ubiquitin carboxyl-terminal hydrolase 2 n=1 Tax=Phalaenopsis equestris TaxID=78828 RepID=UPI0009E1CA15|nr:ubiquitin carboxyl-terminal hydrolase 2 [Phalaenopsis equestris]